MKARYVVFCLVLICGLGCATLDDLFEQEKEIPLSEVPTGVLKAAQGAVDGVTITEAEMEKEDGETVYILEGEADGKEYEIEVSPEGKVLEVEEEDEEDDDEDDDA